LVWTNALADLFIGLSYVFISATLVWILFRSGRNLLFVPMFWGFSAFIVTCGAMHFLEILTLWKPLYWLSTTVKVITAIASVSTGIGLIVFAQDILHLVLRQGDIAVLRGHERFHSLVRAAPMAVVGADCDGRITYWNPSAEQMFGWTQQEILGTQLMTVPPDKVDEQFALLERTLQGEVTARFESERFNRAGDRFPVNISTAPLRDESGELLGIMSTIEDIRERKRIERELKQKSATLATVTQSLNAFLESGDFKAASQRLLTFAVEQTQSAYGFLGVVLDGPVLRVLAHNGIVWDKTLNRELYESKIEQYSRDGHFEVSHHDNLLGEVIYRGRTVISNAPAQDPRSKGVPSGHPPMLNFLGVPIFKGSETVGLIAVANRTGGYSGDELRSLETMSQATGVLYDNYRQNLRGRELERQRANLESEFRQAQKMEVLGQLAGGVAHDFNNMLMVISGSADLLEQSVAGHSAAAPYLEQIRRTTEKAAVMTRQLLAFSRKQILEVRSIDVHEVLAECESMLPRLLGSDVELTFQRSAVKSWIQGDAAQMEQVIANLAINARDAMSAGGRLTISTRNASTLPKELGQRATDASREWLVVKVRDTGCGMDESTRQHIFEPFFTTKPLGKGTGLGLSTVYGIIHQFGGQIHVESRPGAGTSFHLFFPVHERPETRHAASPSGDSAPTKLEPLTVLLADDEESLRSALAQYLQALGHSVLESPTPHQALEMARSHEKRIDVLLTDVVMPGLRGTDLAAKVCELRPEIRVIYMSGYAEGLPEAKIPPGAAFLQKPFRFSSLAEQLKLVTRKA
ncbi:MAG TPA: PAS domain S-box protein, partial [Candidatus Acidoferrum sp.]